MVPDQTIGLLFSTGFRSGGAGVDARDGAVFEFDEETAYNYEASFPESPEWTVALGGDYEHPSGFFAGADARYRADSWSLTVFSDNAFDEEFFTYRDRIGDFDCCATLGQGRLTGVTLRVDG